MLLEGICKYEVETNNRIENINRVRVIKLGMAITEKDYVLTNEGGVVVLDNKMVIFRTDERSSKVFEIRGHINDRKKPGNPSTKCKTSEFLSIYPTTDILFIRDRIHFYFEQPSRTCKDVLMELKVKHPQLKKSGGHIYFIDGMEEGKTKARYIIKAKDGEIEVDISVMKSENVIGIYCINKVLNIKDLRSLNSKEASEIDGSISGIDESTSGIDGSTSGIDESTSRIDESTSGININEKNGGVLEIKLEVANSKEFLVLARTFLSHFVRSRYSFFVHFFIQSIDTFYFTVLKIGNTATVVVSRRIYDFTLLFNCIIEDASQIGKMLQIPLLSTLGVRSITFKGRPLIKKYNFNRINKHLGTAFRAFDTSNGILPDKIAIEQNEYSFWCIQKIILLLKPLTFPGLVACPLTNEMNYLLNGPYPLIISAEDKVVLRAFSRNSENSESLILAKSKSKPKTSNLGFLSHEKKDIILKILKSKIISLSSKTPINEIIFPNSRTVIKYFLNQVQPFNCVYSFDLDDGISFIDGISTGRIPGNAILVEKEPTNFTSDKMAENAYFSYENALSLWLMLYPYEIDYPAVVKENRFSLPFLLRRACIDNNKDFITQILFFYTDEASLKGTPKEYSYDLQLSSSEYSLNDILLAIGCYDKWNGIEKARFLNNIEIAICPSLCFIHNQEKYKILSIENILGCIQYGIFNVQVHGSIMAYFKEYSFPVDCPEIDNSGDYTVFL